MLNMEKLQILNTPKQIHYTSKEYITLYRYTTRYATTELFKKNFTLSYNSTKNSFSQSYENEDIFCNYLDFEMIPDYQMKSVNVKATLKVVVDYEYDLNRDSQTIFLCLI